MVTEMILPSTVSLMALHQWRTKYGSTDRDAVKRLKELERKN